MRFRAAFLTSVAIVFIAEWQFCAGYVGFDKVPVVDGKCQYNGTELTPGEPLKVEFPCEEWSCNHDGDLSITGCGAIGAGRGCVLVKGSGVYPGCCDRLACG
uniref:Single domain-containing protein n=1 Tax=Amblyomma maculatum TaxID=34609 RepID=G3MSW4_AMBMU